MKFVSKGYHIIFISAIKFGSKVYHIFISAMKFVSNVYHIVISAMKFGSKVYHIILINAVKVEMPFSVVLGDVIIPLKPGKKVLMMMMIVG